MRRTPCGTSRLMRSARARRSLPICGTGMTSFGYLSSSTPCLTGGCWWRRWPSATNKLSPPLQGAPSPPLPLRCESYQAFRRTGRRNTGHLAVAQSITCCDSEHCQASSHAAEIGRERGGSGVNSSGCAGGSAGAGTRAAWAVQVRVGGAGRGVGTPLGVFDGVLHRGCAAQCYGGDGGRAVVVAASVSLERSNGTARRRA